MITGIDICFTWKFKQEFIVYKPAYLYIRIVKKILNRIQFILRCLTIYSYYHDTSLTFT